MVWRNHESILWFFDSWLGHSELTETDFYALFWFFKYEGGPSCWRTDEKVQRGERKEEEERERGRRARFKLWLTLTINYVRLWKFQRQDKGCTQKQKRGKNLHISIYTTAQSTVSTFWLATYTRATPQDKTSIKQDKQTPNRTNKHQTGQNISNRTKQTACKTVQWYHKLWVCVCIEMHRTRHLYI